ncbi:MAG: hypothetical protein ACYCUV_14935 [Phycisphaerae bacterium]
MYENVQSPLDASDLSAGKNQSPPEFERPEKPFDFSIKIGCPNPASHMLDTDFFGGLSELPSELRAVVSDDELWFAVF